jgi:hypothetical protein
MPNGVFPVPQFHARHFDRPTLSQRVRTLWHRTTLDHQLAQGVDPATSDELELRAEQLLSRRSELAAYVDEVLDRAQRPITFTVEVPLRRAEVRACADDLLALARRLRDGAPIDVHGAAQAWILLTDSSSPLYLDAGVSLRHAVRSARLALDPLAAPAQSLATAA